MSNYSTLKASIDANIRKNGRQLITGPVLNAILKTVVDSLGDGYLFMGVASPSTNPGAPDQNVAYLAIEAGTYTHMGGYEVADGELSVFTYNGAWSKEILVDFYTKSETYTQAQVNQAIEAAISGKQDTISDLSEIRSGAALGATAYQKPSAGIPSTDMTQSVKNSLELANSSVQAEPIGSIIPPVNPSEFATKEEVSQLGQEVDENETEVIKRIGGEKTYQRTESYAGRQLFVDFPVKAGFTLTAKLVADGVTPSVGIRVRALRTDNQYYQLGNLTAVGGSVSLLLAKDIVSVDFYNNDAYTTQTIDIEAALVTEGEVLKEVGYQMVVPTVAENGKTVLFNEYKSEVLATTSSNYSITNSISVPAHSIIQTRAHGTNCRISQVTLNGYIPLVAGINDPDTIVGWTNNSDTPVNVAISYLTSFGLKVAIYKDVFTEILNTIPNIEDYGKLIDTTPSMNFVDGMVVFGEVKTNTFGNYQHSASPMSVKKGDVICIKEASSLYILAALYKTDASQTYAKHLLPGWESGTPETRYYIIDFDGYVGFCSGNNMTKFNFRKFSISEGVIPEIIKDKKEFIGMTATSEQTITVDSIGFCNITKSLAKRISGNGNATITFTLDKQAMGRCFSIGFRLPYAFQDVASMTLNGSNFAKSRSETRTASGKTYLLEGDHFHRCNFNVCDSKFSSFDIVVTSSEDWYFEISDGGVVNDDLPIIPIVVGYDIAYDYRATFPYNGDNISIYELHKRLNIPYYVALTGDQTVVNPEVAEAIESGLCERVFYGGGELANYWNKIDGSLSQQMILKKSAHEGMGTMYVVSQSVIDRNMCSAMINSGFDIIRHFFTSEKRKGEFGQMYGDNNVYYGGASALGNTALNRMMNYPQLWYAHGIGTPVNPDDPYAANYQDPTGANTIALFNIWKTMEARGELAVMKPSDWIAYLKQQSNSL